MNWKLVDIIQYRVTGIKAVKLIIEDILLIEKFVMLTAWSLLAPFKVVEPKTFIDEE